MKPGQLKWLNADYEKVHGKAPKHFVCPILLVDEDVPLCDGHIMCDEIEGASKKTIIQRRDVDGYFGTTLEPDLIRYLNLAVDGPKEHFARPDVQLSIKLPDGKETAAFFGRKKSRKKTSEHFQQITLTSKEDGSTIAEPFLRDVRLASSLKDMEVSWEFVLSNSAVLGSLVKSAYIALFRIFGYEWVNNACGDRVRRAIKTFYDADVRGKNAFKKATEVFADFEGCVMVLFKPPFEKDTIESNSVLFHHLETQDGLFLFAVSCFFKVNEQMLMVTLPLYRKPGHYFQALELFRRYLNDRSMRQVVHHGTLKDGKLQCVPIGLKYMPDGPPAEVERLADGEA